MSRSYIARRARTVAVGLLIVAAATVATPAWAIDEPTPTPTVEPTESPTPAPSQTGPPVGGFVPATAPEKDAPDLGVGADIVAAGEWIVASAEGYTPGENVELVLYRGAVSIGTFSADSRGALIARLRIPADTRPGQHVLEAAGWDSGVIANHTLTVVSEAVQVPPWQQWWLLAVAGALFAAVAGLLFQFRGAIAASFRAPIDGDVAP